MKKLTEQEAFDGCIAMWEYIIRDDSGECPIAIKRKYCVRKKLDINDNCFFCEFDKQNKGGCRSCPLRVYSTSGCTTIGSDYNNNPVGFLALVKATYAEFQKVNL